MKKNKNISWVISALTFTFLMACADESPVNPLEEEIKADYSSSSSCTSIIDCADAGSRPPGYSSSSKKYSSSSSVSESEKCRLGTSSKSDSYCCSNFGYQCSYTSNETEEEKEMVLTLTYYKQNKTTGEDRDPEISFTVYTINSDGDTLQSLKTDQLTDWDNVTEWDVRIEASPLTIAAGVATIYVCPIIIDDDGILGNQNLSSKYCYGSGNIGTLKNGDVVKQSDYENTKSILEWEWYLY